MKTKGKRGKLKKKLNMIENDMRVVGVCPTDVENRDDWRFLDKNG
jgi:hypothetical protein